MVEQDFYSFCDRFILPMKPKPSAGSLSMIIEIWAKPNAFARIVYLM